MRGSTHRTRFAGRPVFHGHGTDTDIIVASAKAYLAALNNLIAASGTDHPARPGKEKGMRSTAKPMSA